jgi:hypothetical protein
MPLTNILSFAVNNNRIIVEQYCNIYRPTVVTKIHVSPFPSPARTSGNIFLLDSSDIAVTVLSCHPFPHLRDTLYFMPW